MKKIIYISIISTVLSFIATAQSNLKVNNKSNLFKLNITSKVNYGYCAQHNFPIYAATNSSRIVGYKNPFQSIVKTKHFTFYKFNLQNEYLNSSFNETHKPNIINSQAFGHCIVCGVHRIFIKGTIPKYSNIFPNTENARL